HLKLGVAQQPRIQLRTVAQLSGDRRLVKLLVDEARALGQALVVRNHRSLRDPHRGILALRLSDQRTPQRRGPHELRARREHREVRHPDPVERQDLLAHRLVAGDEQPGRRRTGVPVAVHLHHGSHRILVLRPLAEALAAVEHQLWLELAQPVHQRADVVADSQHPDVVALLQQRSGHVVLGFLHLPRRHFPPVVLVAPLGMERIEHHGDLHRPTIRPSGRPTLAISRLTVRSPTNITRPPSTPTAGRISIARRSSNRSDKYPTRAGAVPSPARREKSTNAPSTEARTAGGTTSKITAERGPLYQV